ncbi:uncharacterized protein LOC106672535 [Cimex lectularius]|uniref:Uncharacterized protein n=1 Tax=Cimex lectularius TaxID=79782 RepID=A0A8I6SN10_CIMLE|nr:uncharacterized protein LOC106672535 [Cimex lectularius]
MKLLPLILAASIFVLSTCDENVETTTTDVYSTGSTFTSEGDENVENTTTTDVYSTGSTFTSEGTTTTEETYSTTQQWSTLASESTTHLSTTVETTDEADNSVVDTEMEDMRLSEMIRNVIATYKEQGTVIIPGIDIPDPMTLPDKEMVIGPTPTSFYNMTAHGLSDFTVDHINTNLDKMQVYVAVHMKRMIILGNYTLNAFFLKSKGPFNVTLFDVETSGAVALSRDEDGHLFANESQLDMTFKDTHVDFKNVGMLGHIIQAAVGSVAPMLFDGVKPSLLNEINTKVRKDVNKKLKVIGEKLLTNKTEEPLQIALEEARNYVKNKGYDPYNIKDYVIRHNKLVGNVSHFVLYGLSDFHKVGDINLSMDKGTVQMGIHLVSFALKGKCKFTVGIGKYWEKSIYTNFTVDHLQIRIYVNQSLDMTQHPVLEDLDLNVGKVKIHMEGIGYFDGLIIVLVNTLPDLIRHIIVDAIEEPLKYKVQEILNRVDMQEVVNKTLPLVDNLGL